MTRCTEASLNSSTLTDNKRAAFSKLLRLFDFASVARYPDVELPKNVSKKRRRSNVVEKFKEVSDSVWVNFEAGIIEKTIKEK